MSLLADQAGDFRTGEYRGQQIALLRHNGTWRVFLNQRLLQRYVFESVEDATAWLQKTIEGHLK